MNAEDEGESGGNELERACEGSSKIVAEIGR